ncbi:hypothetical protein ACICHK_29635 [Streptomyces sp. AHU1]|uniref:hypothetical protein n=1 Tax=Streptomyces sp. AHU1 TaxID=3377215 RepID=UPI0038783B46
MSLRHAAEASADLPATANRTELTTLKAHVDHAQQLAEDDIRSRGRHTRRRADN